MAGATFRCHACASEVPVIAAPALQALVGSDCTPVTGETLTQLAISIRRLEPDTNRSSLFHLRARPRVFW